MSETKGFAPRDWDSHPPYLHPDYGSTPLRAPTKPLVILPQSLSELTGPVYGQDAVGPLDHDLTRAAAKTGEPNGERIIVAGQVTDEDGRPVPNILLEVWQPNAAGRYNHADDQHDAPIDPNFLGAGRCVTDDDGHYRFITIKPGAYPWGNHFNAWRPNHIHFSLFGPSILTRLITQMYFPGDPLLGLDPIFNGVPAASRDLLVSKLSIELSEPEWALGYEFNICLRGRMATPLET
ncbi:MAG: protocatechuate 3,4-dioxygenase subunit beta [Rhodospirillaceae bacterium]|jgi:protocatechuate 3,4-dioxygenase, beta subunit|nr:protocatechuate 3,4-dioxygenase subunit beta [Rhodospirillaceae bacterium]MBT4486916.1 protocatechuate 3,4-dioxygenase subunit beta [Rhodospirillaceae bacterium]MBT5194203.1 protocatechuate 3,4-dioxygenase subunit beta [Rhodospirillaceae bacterium]MBT5894262.1 protocatechuate 3,4-dioxygenase subunit beta [Rhodospirillaceae bacterium]MBT6427056.1 protocatechuate 3,4-dioxygenase subunit beta [Rhodospirillaceae bacterium]